MTLLETPMTEAARTYSRLWDRLQWATEPEELTPIVEAIGDLYWSVRRVDVEMEAKAFELLQRGRRKCGLAIRRHQREGKLLAHGSSGEHLRAPSPKTLLSPAASGKELNYIYQVTDGISDDEFDRILGETLSEGGVHPVWAVLRDKCKLHAIREEPWDERIRKLADEGYTTRQIAKALDFTLSWTKRLVSNYGIEIPADRAVGKTWIHDPNRVVADVVSTLEGAAYSVGLVKDDLDGAHANQLQGWVESLNDAMPILHKLHRDLRNRNQEILNAQVRALSTPGSRQIKEKTDAE